MFIVISTIIQKKTTREVAITESRNRFKIKFSCNILIKLHDKNILTAQKRHTLTNFN